MSCYVDNQGMHVHTCDGDDDTRPRTKGCGTTWSHDSKKLVDHDKAHHCPRCGMEAWYKTSLQETKVENVDFPNWDGSVDRATMCRVCVPPRIEREEEDTIEFVVIDLGNFFEDDEDIWATEYEERVGR